VELRGITKRFPGVIANEGVDLTVEPGQIHALLARTAPADDADERVYGLYKQDEGEILIAASRSCSMTRATPSRRDRHGAPALHAGAGVHRDENVMLGVESTRGPLKIIDSASARSRIVEISERHNLHIDPDAMVEDLPVGVRQRVEIVKTLYASPTS